MLLRNAWKQCMRMAVQSRAWYDIKTTISVSTFTVCQLSKMKKSVVLTTAGSPFIFQIFQIVRQFVFHATKTQLATTHPVLTRVCVNLGTQATAQFVLVRLHIWNSLSRAVLKYETVDFFALGSLEKQPNDCRMVTMFLQTSPEH